jgi:hypothetical protein
MAVFWVVALFSILGQKEMNSTVAFVMIMMVIMKIGDYYDDI